MLPAEMCCATLSYHTWQLPSYAMRAAVCHWLSEYVCHTDQNEYTDDRTHAGPYIFCKVDHQQVYVTGAEIRQGLALHCSLVCSRPCGMYSEKFCVDITVHC